MTSGIFRGYDFNGIDAYITVPRAIELEPTATLTVELRLSLGVAIGSQPTAFPMVLHKFNVSGYEVVLHRTNNQIQFVTKIGATFYTIVYNIASWVPNRIYAYAAVVDGTNIRIYVNGVQVAISAATTGAIVQDAAQNVLFGASKVGAGAVANFFDGYLDEVRIWDTARTPTEINDNLWTELIGSETGLVGYWKLNELSGATAVDSTANANDGTITNAVSIEQWYMQGITNATALTESALIIPANYLANTDFGGYTTGVTPYDWDEVWTDNDPYWTVKTSVSLGNKVLNEATYISDINRFFQWTRKGPVTGDIEILMRFNSTDEIASHIFARGLIHATGDTTLANQNAYMVNAKAENELTVSKIIAGSETELATKTFNYDFKTTDLSRTFNGTSNYAYITANAALQPSGACSFEIRCKLNALISAQGQAYPTVANCTGSASEGWQLYFEKATSKLYAQVFIAGAWRVPNYVASGLDITVYHNIAWTFDTRYLRLYVDGDLKATVDVGSSGNNISYIGTNNINIGAAGTDTGLPTRWWINANFKEARLWSVARTPTELQDYSFRQIDPTTIGLIGYWRLGESGTTVIDQTTGGYNGVYSGGSLVTEKIWYWIRFQRSALNLKARLWKEPYTEPIIWDIETADTDLNNGYFGVGSYNLAGERDFDYFSLGTYTQAPGPTAKLMESVTTATSTIIGSLLFQYVEFSTLVTSDTTVISAMDISKLHELTSVTQSISTVISQLSLNIPISSTSLGQSITIGLMTREIPLNCDVLTITSVISGLSVIKDLSTIININTSVTGILSVYLMLSLNTVNGQSTVIANLKNVVDPKTYLEGSFIDTVYLLGSY